MTLIGRVVVLGLLAGITACASPTTKNYEAKLEQLIGIPVDDLVLKWGPPQSSFTMADGRTVIEYARSEAVVYPGGGGTSFGIGGFSHGPTFGTGVSTSFPLDGGGGYAEGRSCKTRFIVSQDRFVRAWSWEGNNCASY